MANKISGTMPYWRHSNYLFSTIEMRKLKIKYGLKGYAMYCLLMERIGVNLYEPLFLDETTKLLIIGDLSLEESEFDKILNDMLDYDMFNKKLYEKSNCLSNDDIEESKRYVISERKHERNKKQNKGKMANSPGENDNFLYKEKNSKEKNSKVKNTKVLNKSDDSKIDDKNDEIIVLNNDNESISLNIGNFLLHTKGELYELSARASNTDYNNKALRNLIDKLYDTNRFILAKSIEYCLNLDSEDINMHFLHKTFNDFLDMEND